MAEYYNDGRVALENEHLYVCGFERSVEILSDMFAGVKHLRKFCRSGMLFSDLMQQKKKKAFNRFIVF